MITPVVAANGPAVLLPLLKVVIAVYLGCFLHAVIVYGGLLKFVGKISPVKFFKAILPAQVLSFTSCSSGGTLPVSMQCIQKLGVSKDISSFVLPLGATIKYGWHCCLSGSLRTLHCADLWVDLTTGQYLTIVLTGTLASIGTAGVPGAGFIMLTMILTAIGLPLEGSALIAGIDRILDMPRTCVNVTGDATVAYLVDKSEKSNIEEPLY